MIKERAASTVILALGGVAVASYLAVGVYTTTTALNDALGGSGCALKSVVFPFLALDWQPIQVSAQSCLAQLLAFLAGWLPLATSQGSWPHITARFT